MAFFRPVSRRISETVQDRTKVTLMTNRKSHTAFDRCQNQRPCMTLNGHCALYSFRVHHENLNEDRPTLLATKMLPDDSSFWQCTLCGNIRGGSLERWRQTTVGLSTMAIFSDFAGYVFGNCIEIWPALLHSDTESLVGFPLIPKHVTLNDLEWLFRVKFYSNWKDGRIPCRRRHLCLLRSVLYCTSDSAVFACLYVHIHSNSLTV